MAFLVQAIEMVIHYDMLYTPEYNCKMRNEGICCVFAEMKEPVDYLRGLFD